jgi:cytokinin dehydrogenase
VEQQLYDCLRSGLGQCGVILSASYPLRACKPRLRSYFLGYDDAAALVADVIELARQPRCELLLGSVGPLSDAGGRFQIVLALGKEYAHERELDDGAIRAGLHFARELPAQDAPLWTDNGIPGHAFFRLHTGKFWNEAREPTLAHPWVDHVFTPEAAASALAGMLEHPPAVLRMGTVGLIPVASSPNRAPLFAVPPGSGLQIGLGVFPNVPAGFKHEVAALMSAYSQRCCELGGKRYLSGFIDFAGEAAWAEHYGPERFAWFREMKQRYDARGLLNPGFLTWS